MERLEDGCDELENLLGEHFPAYRLYGQKLLFQSAIWSLDGAPGVGLLQDTGDEVAAIEAPGHEPVYFIALCAAEEACDLSLRTKPDQDPARG